MVLPLYKYFFLYCSKINAYHLLFISDSSVSRLKDFHRFKRNSSKLLSFISSSFSSTSSVESSKGSEISFFFMLSSDSLLLKVSFFLVFLFLRFCSKIYLLFCFTSSSRSYLSKVSKYALSLIIFVVMSTFLHFTGAGLSTCPFILLRIASTKLVLVWLLLFGSSIF